jgi:hypothetical protein
MWPHKSQIKTTSCTLSFWDITDKVTRKQTNICWHVSAKQLRAIRIRSRAVQADSFGILGLLSFQASLHEGHLDGDRMRHLAQERKASIGE